MEFQCRVAKLLLILIANMSLCIEFLQFLPLVTSFYYKLVFDCQRKKRINKAIITIAAGSPGMDHFIVV